MMNDLYYNHGFAFGSGFSGGLLVILFWIFIVVIIVKFLKHSAKSDYFETHRSKHLHNILKQRYAKGEITKEEFEEKKKYLNL